MTQRIADELEQKQAFLRWFEQEYADPNVGHVETSTQRHAAWAAWKEVVRRAAPVAAPIAGDALPGAHHLTPESISATIADLREIESGTPAIPVQDRDCRTWAGVLARVMEHLRALANQPAPTAAPEQVAQEDRFKVLIAEKLNKLDAMLSHSTQLTSKHPARQLLYSIIYEVCGSALSQPSEAASLAEKISCPECSGTGGVMMEGDCSDCNGKGYDWEPAAPSLPAAPTHCDPAEGFCAKCREQESASHVAPAQEQAEPKPEIEAIVRYVLERAGPMESREATIQELTTKLS